MDLERHPSGISFHPQQRNSGLPSVKQGVDETESQYFHTAGTPIAGEQHKRYLPLLKVSHGVEVIAATSRTLLAQTFVNGSTVAIQEASYCFPLYDGSVVISFRCWLDGKTLLEGKVQPKAAANAEYRDAVARQRVAVLLEEHTPEIFETVIGNIPPRTVVKVEITYVNELKADTGGDGMLVTIPTSIAPRYGTPPTGYLEKSGSSSRRTAENGLKIQIEVSASAPIQKLESLTHPISIELGSEGHPTRTNRFGNLAVRGFDPKKARASLSDPVAVLGKDFVLLIVTSSSNPSSRALIEYHPSFPDHSVIMTTIIPREIFGSGRSSQVTKAEIVFVADRSGSMLDKMEAMINALKVLLERLPEQCLFNICSFGSEHSLLWSRSRLCSLTNRSLAKEFILASFRADLGGTELLPALETVVRKRMTEKDLRTEVIVLTDGQVWNTEATIDFVHTSRTNANDRIRFFALGIGNAVSHRLVESIGRQGGGYAEVVAIDAHSQWESRAIHMLNGALTPSSWQCKISLEPEMEPYLTQIDENTISDSSELLSAKVQKPVCVQAPFRVPTLHAFSRLSIFFIVDRKISLENSVKVEAQASTGESVTVLLPMEKIEEKPPTIHFLAAKALMNDFETEQSWLHSRYETFRKKHAIAFEEIVQQEAETVGKQWSITSKWTSFVAVDHGNKLENRISLYKAERGPFSELAAPLRPSETSPCSDTSTSQFDANIPASLHDSITVEDRFGFAQPSSITIGRHQIDEKIIRSWPFITAEEILATLLVEQNSLGFFTLGIGSDHKPVLESFRPDLSSELKNVWEADGEFIKAPAFLFQTVIVTVYIEKRFPGLFLLWDSAVKKAHDWVREKVKDDSFREKLYSIVRESFRKKTNGIEVSAGTYEQENDTCNSAENQAGISNDIEVDKQSQGEVSNERYD